MITQIVLDSTELHTFSTITSDSIAWPIENLESIAGKAVLFLTHSHELLQTAMKEILGSSIGSSLLCYALHDIPEPQCSAYEILPDETKLIEEINHFHDLLHILPPHTVSSDPEERLLHWLFLHERAIIKPIPDQHSLTHYRFPLPELLGADTKNSFYFLESLVKRRILAEGTLINRIRLCPNCDSGMINIVDHCPSCKSLDINETSFIHCFTCGHVAPEAEFVLGGILRCNNCANVLRHIGSDYDRAMAQFRCNSCGSIFDEPPVIGACFSCGATHLPSDLHVRKICTYTLTNEGRLSIRTGKSGDLYSFLEDSRFVTPSYLYTLLEWYQTLAKRHTTITAHLVIISIVNMAELIEQTGRYGIVRTVEEFVRRIREKMRTTDIAARIDDHSIALFLPQMNPEFIDLVGKRVEELKSQISHSVKDSLNIRWNYLVIPNEESGSGTAQDMVVRLKNNVFR